MKTLEEIYTGKIYADEEVLKVAPHNKGKIEFFSVRKHISAKDLEEEYQKRHLVAADVLKLATWCEKNQKENTYYGTQWKDANGNYCCATFDRWGGGRVVRVRRNDVDWSDGWVFAGVPQVALELDTSEKPLDSLPLDLEINGIKYRRV